MRKFILHFIFLAVSWLTFSQTLGDRLRNSCIWGADTDLDSQQYVVFRKSFQLNDCNKDLWINIFANSRYLLWINGRYVMRGPCRFNPQRPEYDSCNISKLLKKGKNTIAVLAHYYGNSINGRIMKGFPVLTLQIGDKDGSEDCLITDSLWKYSDNVCYRPAPESWNTVIDNIDGRIDGAEWTQQDFDDSKWPCVQKVDAAKIARLMPNDLPLPKETEIRQLRMLPKGQSLSDCMLITLEQGEEIIVDYGKMTLAYAKIKLEAIDNSVLSMRFALRYEEGKTYEEFGGGNRYMARGGMQDFMTTDQWGSHYMILKCDTGRITLHQVKMIERIFPFERLGSFECSDTLLNDLWKMAVNTIEATSDDAYGSDARERNEWIQDCAKASFPCSQVALANLSGKSEMRLLKNMIRHAALSQLPDGRFLATFPTDRGSYDCHYFIDDYACQWFEALDTYMKMTGDMAFVREMYPHLKAQINWFAKQKKNDGLYLLREYTSFDNPLAYITCEGATVNAFLYKALTIASDIAGKLNDREMLNICNRMSENLYESYNKIFWNDREKAYYSAILNDSLCAPTVHAQLIALQSGIVPLERENSTREWLWKNYRNPGMKHCCVNNDAKFMIGQKCGIDMPIVYYWLFNELYRVDMPQRDVEALNEMRRRWKYMVIYQKDAGTLSESFVDENNKKPSESCHNYGSVPAYFLSSYVLGVRAEGTAEKREILIEPRIGDLLFAKGDVVTELGVVKISWERKVDSDEIKFSLSLPDGVSATLKLPGKETSPFFKGKQFVKEGRWIVMKGITGKHSGCVQTSAEQ